MKYKIPIVYDSFVTGTIIDADIFWVLLVNVKRGTGLTITLKSDVEEWLKSCGTDWDFIHDPDNHTVTFTFKKEEDAVLFRLAWVK